MPNGVRPSLSGFPATTPFHGELVSPTGATNQGDFTTDANGEFSIASFSSPTPGVWTATVEWSGGTLVETLDVHCPSGRMVGKGALHRPRAGTASYAYIVKCPISGVVPDTPLEIRIGARPLRLAFVASVVCLDDPAVPTPAAGFDTQIGIGFVPSAFGGGSFDLLEWKFVDGGPSGVNDLAQIKISTQTSPAVTLFDATAAPPSKFPGSTQTTGYNTAQPLP